MPKYPLQVQESDDSLPRNYGLPGLPRRLSNKESACSAQDKRLIPGSGRSPGGGHGNPLQYSRLENRMDRGAWWATVHGVTKSQTRLKGLSMRARSSKLATLRGAPPPPSHSLLTVPLHALDPKDATALIEPKSNARVPFSCSPVSAWSKGMIWKEVQDPLTAQHKQSRFRVPAAQGQH